MTKGLITPSEAADILMIQRTLNRVGSYADQKRWEEHRELFTDEVEIDFGGAKPAQMLCADALMAWSRKSYECVKTQHMFTNQDVEVAGDIAKVASYGRALHERTDTGEMWMLYARYEHTLVRTPSGWKVSRLLMEPSWQTGNPKILGDN